MQDYEWDALKAETNYKKHGISFADAVSFIADDYTMSDDDMKPEYDFSRGKRAAIDPLPPGKERITIRLDKNVLDWFRQQVNDQGGGNYQTMINQVLVDYVFTRQAPLEELLRRVVREELAQYRTG